MASENVLPLEIRKLPQQILNRIPASQVFQNGFHWITQAAHAGLAMTNLGINCDARKQILV